MWRSDNDSDSVDTSPADAETGSTTAPTSTAPTPSTTTAAPTTTTTTTTPPPPPGQSELARLVSDMSVADKARQLLATGYGGSPAAVDRAAGSLCPGGVFVSWAARELPTPSVARNAIAEIGNAAVADGCVGRPLIMTDAEPGTRVLKVPVTALPSAPRLAEQYAADPTDALATITDATFTDELRELGVHVNLGVPADVDVDTTHYMARQGRSFGDDPTAVAALAEAMVDRHCTAGVAATLKHFPNQGATLDDPHDGLSRSNDSLAEWRTRGRVPYADASAPLVMTGHILMDDIDANRPASLSREITTGLLRDDLGYDGVIVTDDLDAMAAATGVVGSRGERATEAIDAGADLVLFVGFGPHDDIIDAIVARAETDAAFARRIDESATQVLRLKAAFGLVDQLDPSWFPLCQPGNSEE